MPAAGDAVVLPALGSGYAVTLDVNASVGALTVGAGATLQMAAGDSLSYTGGTIQSDGVNSYTGGTIQNDGVIVVGPYPGNALHVTSAIDSLFITGSGTIQMAGKGRIASALARPMIHLWIVTSADQTLTGDGDVWIPIINHGLITQPGTGTRLLTLWEKLVNCGTVRVADGGHVNVHIPFVKSYGGTIVGHNGWFTCMMDGNYGPIDNLNGGTFVADGGDLDVSAGVVASGTIIRLNGAGTVGFHDTGNPNNLVVMPGAEMLLDGGTGFHTDLSTFENHGTVRVRGTLWIGTSVGDTTSTTSDGTIVLEGGTLMAGKNMAGAYQWLLNAGTITGCGTIAGNCINAGTVDIECPTGFENVTSPTFVNRGLVTVGRGYLHVYGAGAKITNLGTLSSGNGGILVDQGATVQNAGGTFLAGRSNVKIGSGGTAATISGGMLGSVNGGYFTNLGQATLRDVTLGEGATLYTIGGATTSAAGAGFTNRGTNEVRGVFTAGATTDYVQPEGVTRLAGGTLTVPRGLALQGTLAGTGTVAGSVTNAGVVAPSVGAAGLQVQGDYRQAADGVLALLVGGYMADQVSRLVVTGTARLDGRASLATTGGFVPEAGHTFDVMAFGARTGEFAAVDAAPGLEIRALYDGDGLALQTTAPVGVGGPSLPSLLRFAARGAGFALELPQAAEVVVRAYDVAGRQVAELAGGLRPAGVHVLELRGVGLASGVYFARATVRAGGSTRVLDARTILLR